MDVEKTSALPEEFGQIIMGDEVAKLLPVKELYTFPKHPFKVMLDDQMRALIESIKTVGILTPILVRPRKRGGYEIVSGHRRVDGAKRAKLTHVPAIVKEMSDDLAVIAMVDANMRQREVIRTSEKAFAYQMKMDSIMRMKKEQPNEMTGRTREIVARLFGVNAQEVARFTRLTQLIQPLLAHMDDGLLPFMVGYELSFLPTDAQCWVVEHYEKTTRFPSLKQAKDLCAEQTAGTLTQERMTEMLAIKPIQRQTIRAPSINWERIYDMLPDNLQDNDIEEFICAALERYRHNQRYDE